MSSAVFTPVTSDNDDHIEEDVLDPVSGNIITGNPAPPLMPRTPKTPQEKAVDFSHYTMFERPTPQTPKPTKLKLKLKPSFFDYDDATGQPANIVEQTDEPEIIEMMKRDLPNVVIGGTTEINHTDVEWAARVGIIPKAKAKKSKDTPVYIIEGWYMVVDDENRFFLSDPHSNLAVKGVMAFTPNARDSFNNIILTDTDPKAMWSSITKVPKVRIVSSQPNDWLRVVPPSLTKPASIPKAKKGVKSKD